MATSSDEMIRKQFLIASSTADAMGSDEFIERLSVRLKETNKSTRTARHSVLKSLDIDKRVVRLEMMVETGRQRRFRSEP